MSGNLDIWNALAKTDPARTKKFDRGSFKGTDINPQYRWQRLTEAFGPAGKGWGTKDESFDVREMSNGEVMVFCRVRIWWRDPEGTVHETPLGCGGDFIRKEFTKRTVNDDDAYKKAFTDALGNAARYLGLGADVYLGLFDDSKYVASVKEEINGKANGNGASNGKNHGELHGPLKITELKERARTFATDLADCENMDAVNELVACNQPMLKQLERDLPAWYFGKEGSDARGLQDRISDRLAELSPLNAG